MRLTDDERKQIAADYMKCENYSAVAKEYGVSRTTVRSAVKRYSEACSRLPPEIAEAAESADDAKAETGKVDKAQCEAGNAENPKGENMKEKSENSGIKSSIQTQLDKKVENVATGEDALCTSTYNTAPGQCSFAHGSDNKALAFQFKIGHMATEGTAGNMAYEHSGDAFIVGNGGSSTGGQHNAFRVAYDGNAYAGKAMNSTGADYAEFFEWLDKNADNADRRGLFVTLDGDKIRIANKDDDYILGIVSAAPGMVGNNYADTWQGMWETDIFGAVKTHTVHHDAVYEEKEVTNPETGETTEEQVLVREAYDAEEPIVNPDYNPDEEYIPREKRPEWGIVGMMGQLVVIDDGTCEVNGYCAPSDGGIATSAEKGYRVIARLDETHIKVMFI
ncbi:MAG: helix-turn-helix domain-containing protein [Oscillospiraceae bacterium]|nr:helix-turn-helix domain-containing protein [Oscillospiraceae bacterium]